MSGYYYLKLMFYYNSFAEILGHWETKNAVDAPNVLLMETLFNHLKELHDKELYLNAIESKHFVDLIMKRERDINQHPFPFPRRLSRGNDLLFL